MGNKWDRLDGESDKAFAAFCAYRDLGVNRSLEKAYQQSQNSTKTVPTYWKEWSAKYQWVDRVKVYDNHLLEIQRQAIADKQIAAQVEIIENELSDYRSMRKAIQKRIETYQAINWIAENADLKELLEVIRKNDDMGRRAAGLADKMTSTDLTTGGEKLPSWAEWVQSQLADDSSDDNT